MVDDVAHGCVAPLAELAVVDYDSVHGVVYFACLCSSDPSK